MGIEYSLAKLVDRLACWSGFPKYQLERRVDILLTPFLGDFVTSKLNLRERAVLVAPEFPVLNELAARGPGADRRLMSRRTVNVDYLMYLPNPEAAWLFVELKTDSRSFRPEQADIYAIAKLRGATELRADLDYVLEETDSALKYENLCGALREFGRSKEPIRVAYLAPAAIEKKVLERTYEAPTNDPQHAGVKVKAVDDFWAIEEFASQPAEKIAHEHRELWPHVRDLLRKIATCP